MDTKYSAVVQLKKRVAPDGNLYSPVVLYKAVDMTFDDLVADVCRIDSHASLEAAAVFLIMHNLIKGSRINDGAGRVQECGVLAANLSPYDPEAFEFECWGEERLVPYID